MIVAQFLRSAASAQSRHARIAPARPTSDGTSTWIMSCGFASHKGWPSRTLRYQYCTTIGSSEANGPLAHCGCGPTSAAPRSEEHTSELQSLMRTSYDVLCLKHTTTTTTNKYQPYIP